MQTSGCSAVLVVDASGQPLGILGKDDLPRPSDLPAPDATPLISSEFQRAIFENLPLLVWLKDKNSRLIAANRPFAQAAGFASVAEITGKTDFDIWPHDLAQRSVDSDHAVMASGKVMTRIEQLLTERGHFSFEATKAPVIGAHGEIIGTVGFAMDVSARQQAEEAVILRSAALAGLIRGEPLVGILTLILLSLQTEMPDWRCAIMLSDAEGKHLHLGAAPNLPEAYTQAIDGMPVGEGIGTCGKAAATRQRQISQNVYTDPAWAPYLELARIGDFSSCWSEPILGQDGRLLGTLAVYLKKPAIPGDMDLNRLSELAQLAALVIAHQQASQAIEDSLKTFRGIFDSIDEPLLVINRDGIILDANRANQGLSGGPNAELIGRSYEQLGAPGLNDGAAVAALLQATFAGQSQQFEYWGRNLQGQIFPIRIRQHLGEYFGQPAVIASAQDISDEKTRALTLEIENELSQAAATASSRNELYRAILRNVLRLPEFDAALLHCRQADGDWTQVADHGFPPAFVARHATYPARAAHALRLAEGHALCCCRPPSDACTAPDLLDSALFCDESLCSVRMHPITFDGPPSACLTLASHVSADMSQSTRQALAAILDHVARLLDRFDRQTEAARQQMNLSGLFDSLQDFICVADTDKRILHCNQAVIKAFGYTREALDGLPVATLSADEKAGQTRQQLEELVSGAQPSAILSVQTADGGCLKVETRVVAGEWNGQPAWFGIGQDVSARLAAEERQKLAASVFDFAHEGIMITNAQGRIVEVNNTFSELTGYAREEAIGRNADLLKSGHHDAAFYGAMWQAIREKGFWRGEVWNRRKSGELIVEALTISCVRNREGEITHFVGIFSDITQLKQHQQRLEHLAHFDALTQLPNRMLLGDRMQLAKAQAERKGKSLAVCYLDLDGFKPINDSFGHAVGDRLLIDVAQRLKACLRGGDTVARLGGDEFVLLFGDLDGEHDCDHAINRVIGALAHPFRISEQTLNLSASIGVTLYPQDGADSDTLLRHADQAMYAAKQAGRNRYHLFDPENDRRARIRREEISRIREALANREFVLYYQPKVNMRIGHVIGAEALIRWQHPERGLLQPGEFLPVIENSELSIELGNWVIGEALRQIGEWNAKGIQLTISINIAGNHLQSEGFAKHLNQQLAGHPEVSPGSLELEVLETAALEDMSNVAKLFEECRELGVSFALDDFGTGYSSLTYFRRLPAETLKIDQSFVRDMLDDPDDMAIVEGVIGLTQAFQRQVIAEGVETVEHGLVLLLLGCDLAQGYGIARPMPAGDFPNWINTFRPDELWASATAFRWSREDLPMLIAEVDHNRWKKQLLAYLADSSGTVSPPADDPHRCRFGRWYYGKDSQRYAAVDSFGELETSHAEVHRIGQEMVACHQRGETERIAQLKPALETASTSLAELIQLTQVEMLMKQPK